jgi:tetratricopeptide (TPR) repeat protein
MRRLVILILACTGAMAHGQAAGVPAEPAEPSLAPEPSLAMVDDVAAAAATDPLGTPPPRPATRDQLLELSAPTAPSESPEQSEVPEQPEAPEQVTQDDSETWVVDDQIASEEIAAYEDVGVFLDPGSVEQAQELIKSAGVQLETSEFRDAITTVNAGLVMLEEHLGRYDLVLVEPLTILGGALHGQGDYPTAIDAYERAVHITRVNNGLHATQQVPIIYQEADSWAALGDLDRANERHEYAYETLLRSYGHENVEIVPGMLKLAYWYRQQNNIFRARTLYQYAARALSLTYGMQDPRLIPALHGIAETYRLERFPPYHDARRNSGVTISTGQSTRASRGPRVDLNNFGGGERALQQIVRIQEVNPEATLGDVTVAILELADWNLMFESWERAFTLYEFCYKTMGEEGEVSDEQLAAYFGEPRPLYLPLPAGPPTPPESLAAVPTQGFVEMVYSVTERGKIQQLTTVASEPPGLMDFKVHRAMRNARFRPRIEEGVTVKTPNLVYRHRFEYYPLPEPADSSDEESAQEGGITAPEAG